MTWLAGGECLVGCEVSAFPVANGAQETCLLLEGDVTVTPDGAEPLLTGTWMAHLLISSKELLHNLLLDTVRRPRRIERGEADCGQQGRQV